MDDTGIRDVVVVGAGVAGLSAAIYLGRSRRNTLVIESGRSMAVWEPDVQNYLGFPNGISGTALLERGRAQAIRFGVVMTHDDVRQVTKTGQAFRLEGAQVAYRARRVLLATGLTHLPPEVPGVRDCLGKSLFFCKDCDAFRVQGKRIAVIGRNDEAVEYALAMLAYSQGVVIATNGQGVAWDGRHQAWLEEYGIAVRTDRIVQIRHDDGRLSGLAFDRGEPLSVEAAFTTRGDVYHSGLAAGAGAALDGAGEIVIDACMRTSIPGLYAAGCVTPANCQLIIAAGQGATAAQAINRDLFEESLRTHSLPVMGGVRRTHARSAEPEAASGRAW
jgi:thioredoxin reductase (NADPH)